MYNRRELGKLTLATLAMPLLGPVLPRRRMDPALGVQTGSFRVLEHHAAGDPVAAVIDALAACDVHHCELFAPQIEPRFGSGHLSHHGMSTMMLQMNRRELRKWRLRAPIGYFRSIGSRFEKAGIAIDAFNYSPDASFTDEEIDRGFEMAQALGAAMITASATPEVAARIAPIADRRRMIVAFDGGSPEALAQTLSLSPFFRVTVDLGHFTASNLDALAYLREHHREVASLRLKERRRNHGETLPWGEGDAPIREALRLVRSESWPIRGYVDCDYGAGSGSIDEVKRCLAYAAQG